MCRNYGNLSTFMSIYQIDWCVCLTPVCVCFSILAFDLRRARSYHRPLRVERRNTRAPIGVHMSVWPFEIFIAALDFVPRLHEQKHRVCNKFAPASFDCRRKMKKWEWNKINANNTNDWMCACDGWLQHEHNTEWVHDGKWNMLAALSGAVSFDTHTHTHILLIHCCCCGCCCPNEMPMQ